MNCRIETVGIPPTPISSSSVTATVSLEPIDESSLHRAATRQGPKSRMSQVSLLRAFHAIDRWHLLGQLFTEFLYELH